MIHVIIEGARLYDGVSTEPFTTDVALVGDRIALIGDCGERDAYERVDGRNLALAPGFIDPQARTDEGWLDGRCSSKIAQGVTTEIGGNCGTSVAPVAASTSGWRDLDEFFAELGRSGVALNVATLVGLGTTRRLVHGDAAGRLTADELRVQCDLVRTTVEQGALGVSSGLASVPSRFADPEELIACARASAAAGMARYATHLRDEGDTLVAAVDEALAIGRQAEVAVQLAHHKAVGRKNWGTVHRSLEAIARARALGLAVGADVYPYVALWTDLATLLPDDARLGGRDATLAKLADPESATALALRLALDRDEQAWHDIVISAVASERNAALEGVRLDELARRWRLSPARATVRLLLEERLAVEAFVFAMNEDDVAAVLSADFVSIGSSAAARSPDGSADHGLVHPRTYGCFPRVVGRFVRGRPTLALGEAIRRMTSLPADQFGLADRGRLVPGAYADLVLFDPQTFADRATYERPESYPAGIARVWVNGRPAVRDGRPTGERPGRILRGGR